MGKPEYMRFTEGEYRDRYKRLQEILQKKNLDALMITDGPNWTYFTGMTQDFSYTRPTIFIAPAKGDPIAFVHLFTTESRLLETWIKDVREYDPPTGVPHDMVKQAFKDLSLSSASVGAELGFEQRLGMSYLDFTKLQQTLPHVKFLDGTDVIWGMRLIKSKEEIHRMKTACDLTGKAYKKTYESLKIGMSEEEIVKIFLDTERELGMSDTWALINSHPGNYHVISGFSPGKHRVEKGNMVWMDGGGTYKGYWSDYSRMACIGSPSEKQKKYYQLTLDMTQASIAAIKPGNTAADVAKAGLDFAKKNGVEITFDAGRYGHGVGSMFTEPPHINIYDKTVLKPGMTFAVEPGFVTDFGCFHIEENMVVTEDGHDYLSTYNRDLYVVK
ncbi:MAG: M24 family metallopeptidase [Candidatus Ranarchaeia archaeon]|jgi:Xaa-Pro aminopeptidase